MRKRDLGAGLGLVLVTALVAGLSFTGFRGPTSRRPPLAASSPPGPIELALRWSVVLVGVLVVFGVIVLLIHQYVRWAAYRPAIHLAVALLGFIAVLAWLLGPVGVAGSAGGLTADEARLVRVAGFGLLFFLVLYVARLVEDADGDAGQSPSTEDEEGDDAHEAHQPDRGEGDRPPVPFGQEPED